MAAAKISQPEFFPDSDAHTLAEAAAIRSNPKRLAAAKIAAAKMAEEQSAKARALQALARSKRTKR